jgi:hypothetical protein
MSVLGNWLWPSDMRALQARLLADAQGTDSSVRNCSALDQATRASWGDFYIQVVDFASSEVPTLFFGSRVDHAQELESQLFAWQQKLSRVCALTLPPANPAADKPLSPQADALTKAIQYGSVAAIVVGGAYVIGKLIALVPLPAPRK